MFSAIQDFRRVHISGTTHEPPSFLRSTILFFKANQRYREDSGQSALGLLKTFHPETLCHYNYSLKGTKGILKHLTEYVIYSSPTMQLQAASYIVETRC